MRSPYKGVIGLSQAVKYPPHAIGTDQADNGKESADHEIVGQRHVNVEEGEDKKLRGDGDKVAYSDIGNAFNKAHFA